MEKLSFILLLFFAFACNPNNGDKPSKKGGPKLFYTDGKQMHPDSLSKPVTHLTGKPMIVPAKASSVTPFHSNIHTAGKPDVITAGTAVIHTPGIAPFSLPKVKPAIGKTIACGMPKMVIAKDAASKDVNPGNFSFYKTLQGLNRNKILCMLQDKKGNLLLGTAGGGLSRFDGKFFTNFTQNEGLPNVSVTSMLEDTKGNLWLGSDGGGVTRYDGKSFTIFDTTLVIGEIHGILEDHTGRIWFATDHGVSYYDEHPVNGGEAGFINYTTHEGLAGNEVYCILQDKTGKIWMGTNDGVSCYDAQPVNGHTGSFRNFTVQQGLAGNNVKSIFEDRTGYLWFGTNGGGVSRYDGNRIDAIEKDPIGPTARKTFSNFSEKQGLSSNNISCILEDETGNIWFGTEAGLCYYQLPRDGQEGLFTNFTEQEGLPDNAIHCILKDHSNNLFFGTADGVCIYYGKYFTNFTGNGSFANYNFYCELQDKSGKLWLGTIGNGVCVFDGNTLVNYTTKDGLVGDVVHCILEDRTGKIWMGTTSGISCYEAHPTDGSGARFINYTKKEGLIHNVVYGMLEDKTGKIWIGTTGGVTCYEPPSADGATGHFTNFTEKEGISKDVVCIQEDRKGNLWFGSYNGGMTRFDGKSYTRFTRKEGFPTDNIYCILEDRAGNLWFGTYGNGVLYYNGKSFLNFTPKDGLASDIVQSLFQDRKGNIWLGTTKGLSRISYSNWKKLTEKNNNFNTLPEALFYNYEYNDGFIGLSCHRNAVLQDRRGRIWWGSDRLTCYVPEGDKIDTTAPDIQFTGVKLFGQEIPWSAAEGEHKHSKKTEAELLSDTLGNGIALHHINFDSTSKWYNVPQNLRLPYDNNTISFNFIGIHLQSRNHIKYQYRLHGLEDYWTSTQNTEVSFSNLESGDYSFIVKAMNQSGNWSKPIEFRFTILPPWFRTTPAFVLYVLLSGGLIHLIITNFKTRTLMAEKKKLKILVDERTIEVVTQKNKAEKLLRIKENFLSNMSHEIRTPLNAIIGYIDLSLKETSLLKIYKYLRSIKVSSDHLHHLVNNILDIAKIESGRLTFHRTDFDLEETLEEVKHLMHFLSLRKGNTLHITICKTSSTWVFGDREKLVQVLINLIDNAIKFTENGQIDVHVELKEKLNHGMDAIFSIKDTGIGISEKKVQTIFESFSQADNTITRTYGGTGLGLTICKKIIESQGGEISVTSVEKEGSEFSFRLPYMIGKKEERQTENLQASPPDLKGFRILVAEDDSVNEELLRTILSQWELTADFAQNGEKLLALLSKNQYDLILMDIHMPGMSGVEVATKIRTDLKNQLKDIPIIALTADVLSSTREKIIGSGINRVLYKPINAETLYINIINGLGLKTTSVFIPNASDWDIKTEQINLHYLIESCGKNKNQLLKILSGSFEKLIEYNSSLTIAYQEQDYDQLYFIAHKLGSILKILGIMELDPRLTALKERIHTHTAVADVEIQATITHVDTVIKKSTKEIDSIIEFISKN